MKIFSVAIALVIAGLVGSANIALYNEISEILAIVADARINLGGRG